MSVWGEALSLRCIPVGVCISRWLPFPAEWCSIAWTQHNVLTHSHCSWTFAQLALLGDCEQNCYEHFYTVLLVVIGLHFFGTKEWTCWVTEWVYFNFCEKLPNCFPRWLCHFSTVWAIQLLYILTNPCCEAYFVVQNLCLFLCSCHFIFHLKEFLHIPNRSSLSKVCFGNIFSRSPYSFFITPFVDHSFLF